jgi:hypothetical protein
MKGMPSAVAVAPLPALIENCRLVSRAREFHPDMNFLTAVGRAGPGGGPG